MDGQLDEMNQEDAVLVRLVVEAMHFPQHFPTLNDHLEQAEQSGWTALVNAIRNILQGERDLSSFESLDDEERRIVIAILRGLDDASELPDVVNVVDPQKAGLKIATLIMAIRCGNAQAGQSLTAMLSQMGRAGGEMTQVSEALLQAANGERDVDRLCRNTGRMGSKIIQSVLAELNKRELA